MRVNDARYEDARKQCGAHRVFNAFWLLPPFYVHQMLMLDSMHTIDPGIIVTLIRAILRAFFYCVESILDILGPNWRPDSEIGFRTLPNWRPGSEISLLGIPGQRSELKNVKYAMSGQNVV